MWKLNKYLFWKRIFDIVLSLSFLICLLPFLMVTACLVYFLMGKPVFFRQSRPGLNGKLFKIIKFRTMAVPNQSDSIIAKSDKQRITKFGAFLRSTSIDELPELLNVLMGDMSLVGPRPLLVRYLSQYNDYQLQRNLVKPGITGLAQVLGRNSISWEQKFRLDVFYVQKLNFCLDVGILLRTIWIVICRRGINESNDITATEFVSKKLN